jgi:hypothetical protein
MNFFLRRSAQITALIFSSFLFLSAQIGYAQDQQSRAQENEQRELLSAPPERVLRIYIAKNPEYNAGIQDIIRNNLKTISHSCREIGEIERLSPEIYGTPTSFPRSRLKTDTPEHPVSGQWKDRFSVTACGKEHIFNFLASARKNDAPYMLPLVNGRSRIDPIYQFSAESKAYKYIEAAHADICKNNDLKMVYDTEFIGYIRADRSLSQENANMGWFEKWHVWICKDLKTVTVAVDQQANQVFNILVRYKP